MYSAIDSDTTRFDGKDLTITGKLKHFKHLMIWPVAVHLLFLVARSWLKIFEHTMFCSECFYFSADSQCLVYYQIGPQQISCWLQFSLALRLTCFQTGFHFLFQTGLVARP